MQSFTMTRKDLPSTGNRSHVLAEEEEDGIGSKVGQRGAGVKKNRRPAAVSVVII